MQGSPSAPATSSALPFVGRSAELELLRAVLPRTEGEDHRLVLLGGEPGSGKSRLVREFARWCAAEGMLAVTGACDAVVRTPYGPFVEVLDQLARSVDPEVLSASLGTGAGELTRLLPELRSRVGGVPPPVAADADTERHRLHTAVNDLLAALSRHRPILLVIEDGHWAESSTLLLLRHLARAPTKARLLVIATFRDTDADVPELLAETLADLRRAGDVVRVHLGGLSIEEVADFLKGAAGSEFGLSLGAHASAVHQLTGGNPFLVTELWRSLVETGSVELADGAVRLTKLPGELASPQSVREVVSQRLARLAAGTSAMLEVAATAGSEFDLDLVGRATGLAEAELLRGLDEASRSGMIEDLPSHGLVFRFTHELVRRALYDRLSGIRRAELHLRVGEALEQGGHHSGRTLADLAHHFAAAAPLDGGRAAMYNVRAAEAAIAALAFDEAAARLRTALGMNLLGDEERARLFLKLGHACHRAGDAVDALAAFGDAAELARQLGDAELLALAAIGFEEACWRPGMADQGSVELLEEAAVALGDERCELRVGLLAGLARGLDFQGQHGRAAAAREAAIGMAREIGDRVGLATVLVRSYWSRGSSRLEQILEMLAEARALGDEVGDVEITAEAMAWQIPTYVALCEMESARTEISALQEIAQQTAQPFHLHVADHYASALALCDGRLDEAEALARSSHEWSRLLSGRDAAGVYGIQMFSVRREQGRLAELAPAARVMAAGEQRHTPWRPGLVALLAELGMEAEARRALSRVALKGLDSLRESLWLASLTYLADACSALRDVDTARLVYPELAPYAGSNVMIGHLVSCYGSADRYLGMLAAVLDDAERADEHFERAMVMNRQMGAVTWLARTAFEYGRFLSTRRPKQAAQLFEEASRMASDAGLGGVAGKLGAIERAAPRGQLPDGLSPREAEILRLVARGLSNREIGSALFISEHTAANHIRSILHKTGCANRTEAASYAHRHSLASD